MNILFLLKSFEIGGLEVVTSVLANKFSDEGHNVVLWAFYEGKTSLTDRLNGRVRIFYGKGFNAGKENVKSLRQILKENNIQVVINQWGLPFVPALTLKKASKGLGIKIIAVYHNDPLSNGRTKQVEISLERCDNVIKRSFLKLKLHLLKSVTAASMRYIYRNSDRFMVLSESFIKHFEDFTGIKNAKKLIVQTNPVTINTEHYELDLADKQKEIIYVGRIDHQQKRTSRVIETWALLEDKYPDWTLRIIGDGEERENLERFCKDLNLRNVFFEGFKQPTEYYKRASALLLTSEYEGFGLVIVEGMSFGVVPVVLGSYSAVYDIIKNGENGIIVPYDKSSGFHPEEMAKHITWLIEHETERDNIARNAYESSKTFSLDKIASSWQSVFNNLSWGGVKKP
ncbi:glycosyltransferase [Marseilla massiliensis]|uniref:Glycosyltransferase n=1 Tax=Marseilla massiliensis TaxID=1841864 RepID=A0A939B7B5_9BACT|nr:glycosyltransferase [Marseilla massiliensis]MBM6673392.1 glycosyltransferase [Marseilla massiliensis]